MKILRIEQLTSAGERMFILLVAETIQDGIDLGQLLSENDEVSISEDKDFGIYTAIDPEKVAMKINDIWFCGKLNEQKIELIRKSLLFCATAKKANTKQIRVKSAAVRMPDGQIYEGKNHGEIIQHLVKNLHIDIVLTQDMQGFTTTDGKKVEFVDRKEAHRIAVEAGQIKEKHKPDDVLLSEDLIAAAEKAKKTKER